MRHLPPAPVSDTDLFKMEEGVQVGEMARSLYPKGILITGSSEEKDTAEKETQDHIASHAPVLFEATFRSKPFTTKADMLVPIRGGWKIIEVKASLYPKKQEKKKQKFKDLIDDLAYTVMVASQTGIRIAQASLLLISRDFRKGMEPSLLFIEEDCTKDVQKRLQTFRKMAKTLPKMIESTNRPVPSLRPACSTCEFFSTKCLGKGIQFPVTDIPRLGKKIEKVPSVKVIELPSDFPLTLKQKRVVQSIKTPKPYMALDKIRAVLAEIEWPVFYLDFETTETALPLYPDTGPYEDIVTQYSIHRREKHKTKITHYEFLADNPQKDPRRILTQNLLRDLGTKGNILVYHNFEKGILKGLAQLFPAWEKELNAIIARLVDLKVLLERVYYHPNFHGSYSLKKVLPVLVPGQDYSTLTVQDGMAASASFAKMAMGLYSRREADRARKDLLEYCKQDTRAMIEFHQALGRLI